MKKKEEKSKRKKQKEKPQNEIAAGSLTEKKPKKKKEKEKSTKKKEKRDNPESIRKEETGNGISRVRKKRKRGEKRENRENSGKNIISDERFAAAHHDPRFQRMPRNFAKVTLDSRFSALFEDEDFGAKASSVDMWGKQRTGKSENSLAEYYHLVEDDGGEARKSLNSSGNSEYSSEDEGVSGASDSDSDTSSSLKDDDSQFGVENGWRFWMENQEEAPITEEETRRLAIVNMDWDHIKAVDLFVVMSSTLLSSCSQSGGQVLSVTIYPSDFGIKCMEVETVRGPHALMDGSSDPDNGCEEGIDDDVDDAIVNEKIRSYQLQRLRYYYAVVECDSSLTASHLYNALDGVEFLRTANIFDLRFIPDSMTFVHPPRDTATEAPIDYKQPDFETTALQHSSVKLTWDDDEPNRKKILRRKFKSDQMDELEQYLASEDSQEDEEGDHADDNDEKGKYHALLHDGNEDDDNDDDDDDDDGGKKEMEVTFLPGVENISRHIDKSKLKKSEETVWEATLRKRREKAKSRSKNKSSSSDEDYDESDGDNLNDGGDNDDFFVDEEEKATVASKKGWRREAVSTADTASAAELELLLADEGVEGEHVKGFNLRPKKEKKKKKREKNEELGMATEKLPQVDAGEDPRFNSRLSSSLYALDPTDPLFKRSVAGMKQENALKQGKSKGRRASAREEREPSPSLPASLQQEKAGKEKHEIMSLVRSLKLKSKNLA